MRKWILSVCMLVIACSTNKKENSETKKVEPKDEDSLVDSIFQNPIKVVFKSKDIDSIDVEIMKQKLSVSVNSMANSGEPFNPSDVIRNNLPSQRLIAYVKGPRYRFLAYEQGGRSHNSRAIVFKNMDTTATYYLRSNPTTIEDLKEEIRLYHSKTGI